MIDLPRDVINSMLRADFTVQDKHYQIMFQVLPLAARIMLAVLMAMQSAALVAARECQLASGDHYEQVFCQLSSSRYNYGLPSLQEFRRNSAKVQYLLLKRAASREGIALSKPVKTSSATESRPGTSTAAAPVSTPVSPTRKPPRSELVQNACVYTKRNIDCGGKRFQLRTNRRNSELPAAALSDANVLKLRKKRAAESVEGWLAEAYRDYIAALLSIGLAGSSSTYSAFAHTYYELENSGTDFATRIQHSFALLKKDKRTLAVRKRYPESAPLAADCEWLLSTMIVCNSFGKNWVFTSD